jgi:hypothetical protein
MTERQQRNTTSVAMFSVAVSIIGLVVTLAIGIARIGAIYGQVSNEHQQIFRELRQLADRPCRQDP